MTKIAIIGAGIAGLTAARVLKDHAEVTIFEKSGGVSGRMATRCSSRYVFDHGAQFFGAKTPDFNAFIAPMIQSGALKPWNARFVEIAGSSIMQLREWTDSYPHFVGVPGMNSVGNFLSQDLNIRLNTRVCSISKGERHWSLMADNSEFLGNFDWLLLAIPGPQATEILPKNLPLYEKVSKIKMEGCFSVMLGFSKPLPIEFDAALIRNRDISWMSINSSKPGREKLFSMIVHSTNNWADANSHMAKVEALDHLCSEISRTIGHDVSKADHKAIHQWMYANTKKHGNMTHFWDRSENLGVCGDWVIQGRVEAAFTSGFKLAGDVLKII